MSTLEHEAVTLLTDMAMATLERDWPGVAHVVRSVDPRAMDEGGRRAWAPLVALAEELALFAEKAALLSDYAIGDHEAETVVQALDKLSPEAIKAFEEVLRGDPPADAPEVDFEGLVERWATAEAPTEPPATPNRSRSHKACKTEVDKVIEGVVAPGLSSLVETIRHNFPCLTITADLVWSVEEVSNGEL